MTKSPQVYFQLPIDNVYLHPNINTSSEFNFVKVLIASPHTTGVYHPALCNM